MGKNYISYANSPVYLGTVEGQVPATGLAGINNLIAANSCEISFDTQLEGAKFLGKTPVQDDFVVGGAQQAKISFSYTPLVGNSLNSGIQEASLLPLTTLTGDFISGGHNILVGGFLFKKCFMDSVAVQISPYNGVKVSTTFSSFDVTNITDTNYSGSSDSVGFTTGASVPTMYSSLHALSMGVSGNSLSIPEAKTEISIQTTCSRTPVYELGLFVPSTVILNSVNRVTNLAGEGVGKIVNFSGSNASLSLRFSEFGKLMESGFNPMTDFRHSLDISGRVSSQNLSMQPGRTAEGSVVILSNIY